MRGPALKFNLGTNSIVHCDNLIGVCHYSQRMVLSTAVTPLCSAQMRLAFWSASAQEYMHARHHAGYANFLLLRYESSLHYRSSFNEMKWSVQVHMDRQNMPLSLGHQLT